MRNAFGELNRAILYAQATFGDEERRAVVESLDNAWLASGPKVEEFEFEVAKLFCKRHGVATNSGSSANLLAILALNLPRGGEVITAACTFGTTVFPIVYAGLTPVFVDSIVGRYCIEESLVEPAVTDKTVAILIPQLAGGVSDMRRLREIADRHRVALLDDSCDTLAPTLRGRSVASYADLTTTSFYGSHIITACGMGGMILTDDEGTARKCASLRDWGRAGDDNEDIEARLACEIGGIPYDSKFLYAEMGFGMKMNEAAAAFGLAQLKKLPAFLARRNHVFSLMLACFAKYKEFFHLPELIPDAATNWLAFPLTIRSSGEPFNRQQLLRHLEAHGIQTRVLFSGNIVRHPVAAKFDYRIGGELNGADQIMRGGFMLGAHQGMDDADVSRIGACVEEFLRK